MNGPNPLFPTPSAPPPIGTYVHRHTDTAYGGDTTFNALFSEQFQSNFRAVLEQFQSSFRAVSEQF